VVDALKALEADIMVVAAYGLLLPPSVLAAPRLGCINVHASLLPRWRGAAPIQRAIAAGDEETGITIMQMDQGLDTGAMLHKLSTPISAEDTGGSLHDRLAELGADALMTALNAISANTAKPEAQNNDQATYAHKLSKQDAQLNWQLSAEELHNHIRAFNPWPICQTQLDDQVIRIWASELPGPFSPSNAGSSAPGTLVNVNKDSLDVATGDGLLRITELQLSGGKRLPVTAVLNSKSDWFVVGKQLH